MPDFVIIPNADYVADPDDWTNATFALDVVSPATVTGLTNSTAYVALEIIRGTASASFTPTSAAASTLSYTVLTHQTFAGLVAEPTFDPYDLSSYDGADVYIIYGADEDTEPTVTVGGVSAGSSIANSLGGGAAAGARLWAYRYTLPGVGSSTTTIGVTTGSARGNHTLSVIVVEDGAMDTAAGDYVYGADVPLEVAVSGTPTGATNLILAVAIGRSSFFGTHSWTNATQQGATFTENSRSFAIATAEDVAIASRTVTFSPDAGAGASDEAGLLVFAISEV